MKKKTKKESSKTVSTEETTEEKKTDTLNLEIFGTLIERAVLAPLQDTFTNTIRPFATKAASDDLDESELSAVKGLVFEFSEKIGRAIKMSETLIGQLKDSLGK